MCCWCFNSVSTVKTLWNNGDENMVLPSEPVVFYGLCSVTAFYKYILTKVEILLIWKWHERMLQWFASGTFFLLCFNNHKTWKNRSSKRAFVDVKLGNRYLPWCRSVACYFWTLVTTLLSFLLGAVLTFLLRYHNLGNSVFLLTSSLIEALYVRFKL